VLVAPKEMRVPVAVKVDPFRVKVHEFEIEGLEHEIA